MGFVILNTPISFEVEHKCFVSTALYRGDTLFSLSGVAELSTEGDIRPALKMVMLTQEAIFTILHFPERRQCISLYSTLNMRKEDLKNLVRNSTYSC